MGELEGIGDIVTGGYSPLRSSLRLWEGGRRPHPRTRLLELRFAANRSILRELRQKAHVHRSLRAFFSDLIVNLFDVESKIWRTLPMLAFRPEI